MDSTHRLPETPDPILKRRGRGHATVRMLARLLLAHHRLDRVSCLRRIHNFQPPRHLVHPIPSDPVRNFARPAWRFAVRCPPCLTVGRYDAPRVTLRSFLSHHQSWSEGRCAQSKCGKQSGWTLPSTCRAEKPGCGEHRTVASRLEVRVATCLTGPKWLPPCQVIEIITNPIYRTIRRQRIAPESEGTQEEPSRTEHHFLVHRP